MINSKMFLVPFTALSLAALTVLTGAPSMAAVPSGMSDIAVEKTSKKPSAVKYKVEGSAKTADVQVSIEARGNAIKASGTTTIKTFGEETIHGKVNCLTELDGAGSVAATGTYDLPGDTSLVGVFEVLIDDNGKPKKGQGDGLVAGTIFFVPPGTDLAGFCNQIGFVGDLPTVVKGDYKVAR